MAVVSYPGVYIEEIPSGVRTITGVATSITAFVGRAARGPVNDPKTINGYADFERLFGGLMKESALGYSVRDFFLNGGSQGIIVRLFHPSFADETERTAAQTAADAVVTAAGTGTDPADAATKAAAAVPTAGPDSVKAAAKSVADEIEKAATATGATLATVQAAATAATTVAAPRGRAPVTIGNIILEAKYEGTWGASLRASVDFDNIPPADLPDHFNLTIRDTTAGGGSETYRNLTFADTPRRIDRVLKDQSALVQWVGSAPASPFAPGTDVTTALTTYTATPNAANNKALETAVRANLADPVTQKERAVVDAKAALDAALRDGGDGATEKANYATAKTVLTTAQAAALASVSDGDVLTFKDFVPVGAQGNKTGLYALEKADLFNLLCIPPFVQGDGIVADATPSVVEEAIAYCEKRRAVLLIDPPKDWNTKDKAKEEADTFTRSKNAALYFPHLLQPDPLRDNQVLQFAPSGAVAGVIARTDAQRGVWKAPAGQDAVLTGVPQLSVPLTDAENGELNPIAINCLRSFPLIGRVSWGARTLRGADQLADEYKYLPVRRTALYIEESLYRGLKWVVFEPNDESLWAQVRLNVGAFMNRLFRQGAFQGNTPAKAYFVKCDSETTRQADIDLGIVNVQVGFAPLKPAEFVVVQIQQTAGQLDV